jgi:Tfp pilus assembly protein PilF
MEIRVFVSWRPIIVKSSVRAAMAVAAISLTVVETGCESTPIRAFQGARHYAAGTEALEQDNDSLAIAELEQAAVLVPQASEIQNHLGLAYWSDGRPQSAQVAFEKAIELDCDNVAARVNLERLMRSDELLEEVPNDVVVEAKVEATNRVDE